MIITLNNTGIDTCGRMPKASAVPLNTWAYDGSKLWRVGRTKTFKNIWKPAHTRAIPAQIKTAALLLGLKMPS
jgi:hypothetical protein